MAAAERDGVLPTTMKLKIASLILMISFPAAQNLSAQTADSPKPPVAKKIPKVDVMHGDKRVDDYYWLREKTNTEVRTYIDATYSKYGSSNIP